MWGKHQILPAPATGPAFNETAVDMFDWSAPAGSVPRTMALHLSAEAVKQSFSNADSYPDIYAKIWWGVEQASHYAEVDVLRGTSLSLVATAVRVRMVARNVPNQGGPPWQAYPSDFNVSASIGIGEGPSNRRPTRTLHAPPGAYEFEVPRFARDVTIRSNDAAIAMTVDLYSAPASVARFTQAGGTSETYQLGTHVHHVLVTPTALNLQIISACFGLEL